MGKSDYNNEKNHNLICDSSQVAKSRKPSLQAIDGGM